MQCLPLIITPALIFSGCSAGAGMQATPPAPISQSGGSTESGPFQITTGDTAAEDAADAAATPPISKSVEEASIPTGAGGRFLRA